MKLNRSDDCARRRRAQLAWAPLLLLAHASIAGAQSDKVAATVMSAARAQGTARVIVRLAGTAAPEGTLTPAERGLQRRGIAAQRGAVIHELTAAGGPFRLAHAFATIPYVALEASPDALATLESSGEVVEVQEDRLLRPLLGYDVSLVEADQAWAAGFDGTGATVAILDTGVEASHPMLSGKVVAESCFSSGGNCPNGSTRQTGTGSAAPCTYATQDCGHGTYVAGIAAGSWASQDLIGVARGASIIAIQIFSRFSGATACAGDQEDPCAQAYSSDIIAGLERVAALAPSYAIAAANLSLGGQTYSSQSACDAANGATKAAIDNLASLGIATVIASGNDGDASAVAEPGCISSAISVGSTNASDQISSFSDSASFLSLLAPGENITSAFPGGQSAIGSGTSAAAPHVTGAWAILKEKSPAASVDTVESALRTTGLPLTDARNGVVTPRIRILEALDALAAASPTPTPAATPGASASTGIGATPTAVSTPGATPTVGTVTPTPGAASTASPSPTPVASTTPAATATVGPTPAPGSTATPVSSGTTLSSLDRLFLDDAVLDSFSEATLGELAASQAETLAARSYAQRMVTERESEIDALLQVAVAHGLTPSACTDQQFPGDLGSGDGGSNAVVGPGSLAADCFPDSPLFAQAASGGVAATPTPGTSATRAASLDFDVAYVKGRIFAETRASDLYAQEAALGSAADIQAHASAALATLRADLRDARSLYGDLPVDAAIADLDGDLPPALPFAATANAPEQLPRRKLE